MAKKVSASLLPLHLLSFFVRYYCEKNWRQRNCEVGKNFVTFVLQAETKVSLYMSFILRDVLNCAIFNENWIGRT